MKTEPLFMKHQMTLQENKCHESDGSLNAVMTRSSLTEEVKSQWALEDQNAQEKEQRLFQKGGTWTKQADGNSQVSSFYLIWLFKSQRWGKNAIFCYKIVMKNRTFCSISIMNIYEDSFFSKFALKHIFSLNWSCLICSAV